MKKAIKVLFRIVGIFILTLLLAAIIIPVLFKDQIKEKVVSVANEKINAELAIGDFGITLLRNFPNLTFRLKNVSVTGVDKFQGDTLAGFESFNLVFDIGSVLSKSGYRIKAIDIDKPVASAIVLEDGSANYDIAPESEIDSEREVVPEQPAEGETDSSSSDMAFNLNRFSIKNANISYTDLSSGMKAKITDLNIILSGNMAASQSQLIMESDIAAIDFILDGTRMLNQAEMEADIDINADMANNKFTLGDNKIMLNDLELFFTGDVQMDQEDIIADLSIGTGNTSFKSVLSMVPAIYMEGFDGLDAGGTFDIQGVVKGRYSAADSLLPDVNINLSVNDGSISYPDLPESVEAINIISSVIVDGENLDGTIVNLERFHFEIKDNPFDMQLMLQTPITDPQVKAGFNGAIDFAALADAVPLETDELLGFLEMSLALEGTMSMIENKDFDSFKAEGSMKMEDFRLAMEGLPPVAVNTASFVFTPAYAALEKLDIDVADNIINISGRLENYLPFIFEGGIIIGQLDLYSDYLDLDTIMSYMPEDTSYVEAQQDTVSLATIRLPSNIDFEFRSVIDRFKFSPLEAREIRGNIILRDGVLYIQETGLRSLGGEVVANAEYDSRDSLNTVLRSDLKISDIGIRESFNTFNTIQKLAPVAEGMDGDISVDFDFSSMIGKGMMPVTESINGSGRLRSDEIQLMSSPVYEKLTGVLQIGKEYSNRFKDVDLYFEVRDGRVYIKPFDTRMGDMKITMSGDHGIDQTINYLMKIEVPSEKLPGTMKTVLSGMAAKAALLGISYQQPEVIKMNVIIDGTVTDPNIKPSLGQGEGTATVKEAAKEAVTEIVEEKVDEVKEQVSDEAQKQADRILAEAQKKADLVKSEAADAADRIRQEADTNAQKLIDEASGKGAIAKMAADRAAKALRNEADKKATKLEEEAATQADRIIEEARKKAGEILNK